MGAPVRGLSSMATRPLLVGLGDVLRSRGVDVEFDAAGGAEIARRIRAGVEADLAILGADEMAELDGGGWLVPGSLQPLFVSDVVAAVPVGVEPPPLNTERELREALRTARRIAYSTGPSGRALVALLERWELAGTVQPRLVQARPGTPVAHLLAEGQADLGFQQYSEMAGVRGVRVLGRLPGAAAIRSTFSGAVLARSGNTDAARSVLSLLASQDLDGHVTAAGMARA
jgi:molybdate transport system substrate-binding protein